MRRLRQLGGQGPGRPASLHAVALLVYTAVFCGVLVPKLLPDRVGRILSNSPADGALLLWALRWWPHAMATGQLMPYTHAVYAPDGVNLAWTTSIPTLGVLLAPVTLGLGTGAAFNVASVAAPILAALTTYLLAHSVTGRWGPSLLAGLLFGLSPLELAQVAAGHLNLSWTALVPLAAYLVVRRLDGSIRAWPFVIALTLVLAAQIGISTEVLAMGTVFGVLALVLLYAFDRRRRPALRRCAGLIGLAYVGAAALASPLLYAAFALPHRPGLASGGGTAVPFSGVESHVGGGGAALALVLLAGVALLGAVVFLVLRTGLPPAPRALALTGATALACAPGILVVGATTVPTPWTVLRGLAFLQLVRPQRLTMFAWLIGAVGLGTWLAAREGSWRRWAAGGVAVAAMLPAVWLGSWTSTVPPAPFTRGDPGRLARGANVAVVAGPLPRSTQYADLAFPAVWQAESRFAFRLANAYVGSFPPPLPYAVRRFEFRRPLDAEQGREVRTWLRRKGVDAVLVVRPTPDVVGAAERLLGTRAAWLPGAALVPVLRRSS